MDLEKRPQLFKLTQERHFCSLRLMRDLSEQPHAPFAKGADSYAPLTYSCWHKANPNSPSDYLRVNLNQDKSFSVFFHIEFPFLNKGLQGPKEVLNAPSLL